MKRIGLAFTIALLLVLGATQTKADGIVVGGRNDAGIVVGGKNDTGIVVGGKNDTGIVVGGKNGQLTDTEESVFEYIWNFFTTGIVVGG